MLLRLLSLILLALFAEPFLANLDERSGHRITLHASADGSFTITNARTGFTKHYDATRGS